MENQTVFVDAAVWPYRGMVMCHMLSECTDTLQKMADAIGVDRKHFQNHRYPHYDICKAKRAAAIKLGAVEIGRNEFVALATKLATKKENG